MPTLPDENTPIVIESLRVANADTTTTTTTGTRTDIETLSAYLETVIGERPRMPFNPTEIYYCENCEYEGLRSDAVECATRACRALLCEPCMISLHTHNGMWCAQCNMVNLNNGQSTFCDEHEDHYCNEFHAAQHVACNLGGYDSRDDGRYSGRPPVDGFGREASLNLLDADYVPDDIVTEKRAAALELEVEYNGPRINRDEIVVGEFSRLRLPNLCGIAHDGSLRDGIEVTTPPAKGHLLRKIVEQTCETLIDGGYIALDSCGMHTHIDMRDHKDDKRFLSHLFNTFFAVEDILYAMQETDRQYSTFTVPLRNNYKFFDMYGQMTGDFEYTFYKMPKTWEGKYRIDREKEGKYAGVRYASFNFHSVFYRGSLECRIHEGNVSAEVALRWINLLQKIISRVEKGHSYAAMKKFAEMDVTKKKVELFARYFGLTDVERDFVVDRINTGQGFGYALNNIAWGVPVRGRPKGEPKQRKHRLAFVGVEVSCFHCGHQWVLQRGSTMCPLCQRRLMDSYGGYNYCRVATRPIRGTRISQHDPTSGLSDLELWANG